MIKLGLCMCVVSLSGIVSVLSLKTFTNDAPIICTQAVMLLSLERPDDSVLLKLRFAFSGRDVARLKSSLVPGSISSCFRFSSQLYLTVFQICAGRREAVVAEM